MSDVMWHRVCDKHSCKCNFHFFGFSSVEPIRAQCILMECGGAPFSRAILSIFTKERRNEKNDLRPVQGPSRVRNDSTQFSPTDILGGNSIKLCPQWTPAPPFASIMLTCGRIKTHTHIGSSSLHYSIDFLAHFMPDEDIG